MGLTETETVCDEEISLTTMRLTLRRPHQKYADALAVIANDWEIASKLSTMPHPYSVGDANDYIACSKSTQLPDISFFIWNRDSDELMGCCSLRDGGKYGAKEAQIGYWLGRSYWGQGFATEAVHALIDFAFCRLHVDRLNVSCRVTNTASRHVIHKCGFQLEGSDLVHSQAMGGSIPVECYLLDRSTWQGLRSWRMEADNETS